MDSFIQFIFSGLTVGSMYALTALGIVLIYNASGLINFAQGEFSVLGGLTTASLVGLGVPMLYAIGAAVIPAIAVGILLYFFSWHVGRKSTMLEVIIMTVAVAMVVQGGAQVIWGKELRAVPPFTGDVPISWGAAAILPQALWVLGISSAIFLLLAWFFGRTVMGKAILATAFNFEVARMMGVNIRTVQLFSFVLAALLGAVAGIVTAPITFAIYDAGLMVGLKGIIAALIGGIGSGAGAVVGGLLLGMSEAMTAGYISSQYKDAVPLVLMLVFFMLRPHGIFAGKQSQRV